MQPLANFFPRICAVSRSMWDLKEYKDNILSSGICLSLMQHLSTCLEPMIYFNSSLSYFRHSVRLSARSKNHHPARQKSKWSSMAMLFVTVWLDNSRQFLLLRSRGGGGGKLLNSVKENPRTWSYQVIYKLCMTWKLIWINQTKLDVGYCRDCTATKVHFKVHFFKNVVMSFDGKKIKWCCQSSWEHSVDYPCVAGYHFCMLFLYFCL